MTRRRVLSDEQRAVITGHLASKTRGCISLAHEYGVSVSTIYSLKPAGMRQKRQPPTDLTGQRFGSWTVLERAPRNPLYKNRNAHWICRCACGATGTVRSWSLITDRSTQCLTCRNRGNARPTRKSKKEEQI